MYKKVFIETFDSIFKNFDKLLIKLFLPTFIITLLNFSFPKLLSMEFLNNTDISNLDINQLLLPSIVIFILIMTNISIAVTVHRIAILGIDSVPTFGSVIFGYREFKMLFRIIQYSIIVAIPLVLVSLIPLVGIFIAIFLSIILTSRLSLVFPASACDEKFGFLSAWRATSRYKLLTIVMVILFPLLFSFTVGLVYTLAIEFLIEIISSNLSFLYSILDVFLTVFFVSALSSVYNLVNPRPLNESLKDLEQTKKEIRISSRNDYHKVTIDDKYKTSFESLKKELYDQYKVLGFTDIVYERPNSWILKNPNEEIPFISLRYENNEYFIYVKSSVKPKLSILKKP